MKRSTIKSILADKYDVPKMTSSFINAIAADDSELHSTAISIFLDTHPNVSRNTVLFWSGILASTEVDERFANDTNTLKSALIDNDCVIISDVFKPSKNIRRFTVVSPIGTKIQFTCSLLDDETHVSIKKVTQLRNSTHDISRFTSYYVKRALQTVETSLI